MKNIKLNIEKLKNPFIFAPLKIKIITMKNTLKIGFLAIMFAFVFVACKPKEAAEETVEATEEVVDAATEVVETVDSAATAIVDSAATVVAE